MHAVSFCLMQSASPSSDVQVGSYIVPTNAVYGERTHVLALTFCQIFVLVNYCSGITSNLFCPYGKRQQSY
jgi:hypothetical protein